MPHRQVLRRLKAINLQATDVTLALVKEYKVNRVSQYSIKYVPINESLETKLREIVIRKVRDSNAVDQYTYDAPEPEDDQVRSISAEETDFHRIFESLMTLNPEEDVMTEVDELVRAKAYLIVVRNENGIQVVGFKTIPVNWKMTRDKGLINLLFKENRFEDLEDETVFSISNTIDFLFFEETLFILSKKEFERGLNFREGMLTRAEDMYGEVRQLNLFVNLDILTARVGNNQRYLRKIATIRNLGHYRNPAFLQIMQQVCQTKGWPILFQNGQVFITEDSLDSILSILQNKRLHSDFTDEDFDVDGKIDPL
jgi:hypothetical protein